MNEYHFFLHKIDLTNHQNDKKCDHSVLFLDDNLFFMKASYDITFESAVWLTFAFLVDILLQDYSNVSGK